MGTFNKDTLQKEIVNTWGAYGSHNEVFNNLLKQLENSIQLKGVYIISFSICGIVKMEYGHILESQKVLAFENNNNPFLFTEDCGVTFENKQYSVRVFSSKHKAEKHFKFRLEEAIKQKEVLLLSSKDKLDQMQKQRRELTLTIKNKQ